MPPLAKLGSRLPGESATELDGQTTTAIKAVARVLILAPSLTSEVSRAGR
jgi:hypothetical protein